MKRTASVITVVASLCVPFFGESSPLNAAPLAQRCSAPHCRCQQNHAYQKDACQKPLAAQPEQAPQAAPQAAPQPTGYYAAPPQTGTIAGGTSSTGIDGFALHFPALTLKLPTIQLPSLFRMRTNPRMLIDPAQAPYVQQPPVALGAPIAIQAVPSAAPAKPQEAAPAGPRAAPSDAPTQKPRSKGMRESDSPYTPEPDDVTCRGLRQRLILRERQLELLDERLQRLAESLEQVSRSDRDRQTNPLTEASYTGARRDATSTDGTYLITRLPTVESEYAEVTYRAKIDEYRSSQASGQLVQHVGGDVHYCATNPLAADVVCDRVAASGYLQPLAEPRKLHVVDDIQEKTSLDDADNSWAEKKYVGVLCMAPAAILGGLMTGIVLLLIPRIRPIRTAELVKRDAQPTR